MRVVAIMVAILSASSCDHPRAAAVTVVTRVVDGSVANFVEALVVPIDGTVHAELGAVAADGTAALALITASKSPLFDECNVMSVIVDGNTIMPKDTAYQATVGAGHVIEHIMQEIGPTAMHAISRAKAIEIEVCGRRQAVLTEAQVATLRRWAWEPLPAGRPAIPPGKTATL